MITKDIGIMELVQKFPKAGHLLMASGLGCIGCAAAQFETLEQGVTAHGMDIDAVVDMLNRELGLS